MIEFGRLIDYKTDQKINNKEMKEGDQLVD